MNGLKRLAKRLGGLRDALAEAEKNGAPELLLGLGRDAVFAWLRGEGSDEWIERLDVQPAMPDRAGGRTHALRALLRVGRERGAAFRRRANAPSFPCPKTVEQEGFLAAMLPAVTK